MSLETQEAAVLDSIVPQLEAEGFEVFAHPSAHIVPPFMRGYSPDAIALRKDRKLAIEVLREGPTAARKLDKVRALLSGHQDWELRVYWVSRSNVVKPIELASRRSIVAAIDTIEALIADGRAAPALLMAWSTFEALGRALLPDKLDRPQPPARLVEGLAFEGHITPNEADHMRRMAELRNQLAHGGLQVKVGAKDLKRFLAVLRTLLTLMPAA